MNTRDTASIDLVQTVPDDYLEANVRLSDGTLEIVSGPVPSSPESGLRIVLSPDAGNTLFRDHTGNVSIPSRLYTTDIEREFDPQFEGQILVDQQSFTTGFPDDTGPETPTTAHDLATVGSPLNAQVIGGAFTPLEVVNYSGNSVPLLVEYSANVSPSLQVRTGHYITLKFQVSVAVNGGAFGGWSTYSEVGIDHNDDPEITSMLSTFPPPQGSTAAVLAPNSTNTYRARTLVCWHGPLPDRVGAGAHNNVLYNVGNTTIDALIL